MKKIFITILLILQSLIAEEIYTTFDVVSEKSSELGLSASGVVANMYVNVGDKVKKGELILSLYNAQEKTEYEIARKNAEHSAKTFERYSKISNVIDKTQLYTSYFESFFQKDYDFISSCFYEGIKKGEFFIDNVELLTNTIIMVLKGVLIKAKASNLGFYEAQNILTLHISYLLDQFINKQKN